MPIISSTAIRTVSEVTNTVKQTVESNIALKYVRVRGEISNLRSSRSKIGSNYLYFTLKDRSSQLPVVMFEGVDRIPFAPKDGDTVVCEGKITVYAPYGKYQLQCYSMSESGDGEGDAAKALEELKKKLQGEGLFDQKREIPKFPKKIAVITSAGGAALQDIKNVIERRYPVVTLCVIPAVVQGENAVPTLVAGLKRAQTVGADLIIFGRGGGSTEDLDCFNSETLARAVYASRIPTISAVGHQINTTIADLTADRFAPTPSAAAEIAVPDKDELLAAVLHQRELAASGIGSRLIKAQAEIYRLQKEINQGSPRSRIAAWEQTLLKAKTETRVEISRKLEQASRVTERLREETRAAVKSSLARAEAEFLSAARSVSDLNPMGVLARGYSLTEAGGRVVTDAKQLCKGDTVKVRLEKGAFSASVTDIFDKE